MMITALAKAGKTFQNGVFVERAIQASQFIEENLFVDDRLMARYRDGETKFNAYLDDYVYLIWAYIELYESTYDLNYLQKAKLLMDDMIKLFWDETNGGFYYTGSDSEKDRKSTRLNSSHVAISYAVFCLKKKNKRKASYSMKEKR